MQILIIEIIQGKAKDNKVWFHIHPIDLEEFELLISCVAGYARINNLERVWIIGITGVQTALENCCIKLT
jgi:hypothetical protein